MGLKANFSNRDLDRLQQDIVQDIFNKSIQAHLYFAETVIIHARQSVGFTDQTGHLRSSIGYILFVNGQVYKESFDGQAEGVSAGKEFAKELASSLSRNPIVLVFTAGMNYALSVESKGYNVLSASESYAKSIATQILNRLK